MCDPTDLYRNSLEKWTVKFPVQGIQNLPDKKLFLEKKSRSDLNFQRRLDAAHAFVLQVYLGDGGAVVGGNA